MSNIRDHGACVPTHFPGVCPDYPAFAGAGLSPRLAPKAAPHRAAYNEAERRALRTCISLPRV